MRDLVLTIDPALGRRSGLEHALRSAIRSGQLAPGAVLPSSRSLATDLGMARATVVAAYEQLAAEGYVHSRQGVGTVVAAIHVPKPAELDAGVLGPVFAADFRPGEPDVSMFPRSTWMRSVRRAVEKVPDQLFGYSDPLGRPELRWALTNYLGRSRAVFAVPDAVSIFGGVHSAFGFLGELLRGLGTDRVAVEDPSLFLLRDVLELVGLTAVPVPVDSRGLQVSALCDLDVGAVVVTPSHQYPLGVTMGPERRAQLIDWARCTDSWIIEDDYDGEFRYDRQPIGALQGLDPGRVIYAGTASKSLAPSLRIAWLVVPPDLRGPLARLKHLRAGVSSIDQLALADFIERGELDRQLRAARNVYRRREQAVRAGIADAASWLSIADVQAGLHLTAFIDDGAVDEDELVSRAAEESIGLLGLGPHWHGVSTRSGLVLGYSRSPEHGFPTALERLVDFLRTS